MADTEYLNEERKKTWKRIEDLEQALPAVQKLAEDAKKIAENKIGATEEEATEAFASAQKLVQETSLKNDEIQKLFDEVKGIVDSYNEYKPAFIKAIVAAKDVNEKADLLSGNADKILEIQNNIKVLQEETTTYCSQIKKAKEDTSSIEIEATSVLKKVSDLQTTVTKKKSEIDDLYDEIMGYETENQQHVNGLKDELEKSYNEISTSMKKLSEDFQSFQEEKVKEVGALMEKIRSLLPDAMSAGLAGAFYDKRILETNAMKKAAVRFERVIMWMGIAALIPVSAIILLLIQNGANWDTFKRFPSIVCAMLPVYAPLIWLGIHQNKVINLNKKLIEEYAYKEAISKTVDGLSNQIQEIKDEETSKTLHERLLSLLLDTSSDNPGKYIKGYDKSDNPIAELFNNPSSLKKFEMEFPGMLKCIIETQEKMVQAERNEEC